MGDRTLNLAAFNIRKCCSKLFNAIVVGKKHTGKSTLIQDMLFYLAKSGVPRVCVFSGTEESNGFYKQFIPGTFIFDDNNVENRLECIIKSQKKLSMQKQLGYVDPNLDTRIVIVLDDVGYRKDILKSEIIRQIFMNGRHHHVILIVACQYCMDVGIDLRTNADYVYVLKQNSVSSIKNLHKNYFGAFEKRKELKTVLDACTQNYQCLVLDNTKPSTMVSDVCFWYQAKLGRKFRVGCPQLWDFHDKWFVSDAERYLDQQRKRGTQGSEDKKRNTSKSSDSRLVVRKRGKV